MPEICRFNASKYGKKIAAPALCSPGDNNACRAADSDYYLHGTFACCNQTAIRLLEMKGGLKVVSRTLTEIQNSTPDPNKPRQIEANQLKAKGITEALEETGHK